MAKVKGLKCIECGKEYAAEEVKYACTACKGNLDVEYNYGEIKQNFTKESLALSKEQSIWRYAPLLPVNDLSKIPPVQVGTTPLYRAPKIAEKFGIKSFYVKDDGRNPSCSFKDRASAVLVTKALEMGEPVVCAASTGNAASSLACLSGSCDNLKTIIFVPKTAPKAKVTQLMVYGATVITVNGTYDDAFDLSVEASNTYGWYNRNTGYNPYTREGKKTCAYEIAEQLSWKAPTKLFVSVGDGNIISGIWKGFKDLKAMGFIEHLPQLVAVQAEHSNAVKKAFESDGKIKPVSGKTIADSISVSIPRDGAAAVKALKESVGFALSVTDKEILKAIVELARGTNVFAEPAGACAYAGVIKAKAEGLLHENDEIAVVVTGNGLKDIDSAMKAVGEPYLIEPDIKALRDLIGHKKIV